MARGSTPDDVFATVTVRGEGRVDAVPDEAYLSVIVTEEARSRDAALEAVTERVTSIEGLLDELEIDEGDRTSTVQVGESRERDGGRWLAKGFRATTRLDLRIRRGEVLGRLIPGLVEHGDAEVLGPRWTVSHRHPARTDACRQAAADARTKAEAYARGAGSRVEQALRITEPGLRTASVEDFALPRAAPAPAAAPGGAPRRGAAAPDQTAAPAPELVLHPGTREIHAAVEVVFALLAAEHTP